MQPSQWLAPLTVGWQIPGGQGGTLRQEPLAFWTPLKLAVHSLVASFLLWPGQNGLELAAQGCQGGNRP